MIKQRLKDGDMVDVPAGATSMPPIVTIKLSKLIETSVLINMGPFPGLRAIKQNATSQKGPMKPFVTGGFDPDWGGAGNLLSYGPPGTAAMIRLMEAGKPAPPPPVIEPGQIPTRAQTEVLLNAGLPVPNVSDADARRILRGNEALRQRLRDRLRPPVPVVTPAPTPQPTRPPIITPPIATPRPTIRPPIAGPLE